MKLHYMGTGTVGAEGSGTCAQALLRRWSLGQALGYLVKAPVFLCYAHKIWFVFYPFRKIFTFQPRRKVLIICLLG